MEEQNPVLGQLRVENGHVVQPRMLRVRKGTGGHGPAAQWRTERVHKCAKRIMGSDM